MTGDVILITVTRLLIPFIQVFGVYVVTHGHLSPGGAFAGGAVIASSFILGAIALGQSWAPARSWGLGGRVAEAAGGAWYVLIGLWGVLVGTGYLSNLGAGFGAGQPGTLLSGGFIGLIACGLGLKVTVTLFSLFRAVARGTDDD